MLNLDELSAAERRLWDAAEAGQRVTLLAGGSDEERDPSRGFEWGPERTVRAIVLIELLTSIQLCDGRRPRAVRLELARIDGMLDLEACDLHCPLDLSACFLDQVVQLDQARTRHIALKGCHLPALKADQISAKGSLDLEGAHAAEVTLREARIGGQLILSGARLSNPDGRALVADGAQVEGDIFCRDDFRAEGELRMPGVRVGGQLSLSGAKLSNPKGRALLADGAQIKESMFCRHGFRAEGELRLLGISIERQLDFSEATLVSESGRALCLERATVRHLVLEWDARPVGILDFKDARIAHLDDGWPATRYVARLDGLVYERLTPLEDVVARLDWLSEAMDGYRPQPYEQLATVLRRAGRDDAARAVAIGKERQRRSELNWLGRVANRVLDTTVGYGYRVWQGALWLACVTLVDWGVVAWAKAHRHMVTLSGKGQPVPQFHSLLYALDSVLPVVNLRQKTYWSPTGVAQYWNTLSAVLGWVLVTLILGALTVRLVRD
jgi:hypothetical protein